VENRTSTTEQIGQKQNKFDVSTQQAQGVTKKDIEKFH